MITFTKASGVIKGDLQSKNCINLTRDQYSMPVNDV